MSINNQYLWVRHPKSEQFILDVLSYCEKNNQEVATLQKQLLEETSTRLFDWLDHVSLPYSIEKEDELRELGFVLLEFSVENGKAYYHPGAQLPRVILDKSSTTNHSIAVKVESIADFLMVHASPLPIEGTPFSAYRRCCFSTGNNASLWIIERRSSLTLTPTEEPLEFLNKIILAKEEWKKRSRDLTNEEQAMQRTLDLAKKLVNDIGQDMAAWIVLEGERAYWEARNTAGQHQKNRQDRIGMGWANHDHHTFRSSRRHFAKLTEVFKNLGFMCRERFYAGEEAGWGAQVMENSRCGLVLFLDVDLFPEEVQIDFSSHDLKEREHLGTLGLWCGLHGDSILKAGMHHLEAQFMFDKLTEDLGDSGFKMMNPFSSFSYLKQAFTTGENWKINPNRIQNLLDKKLVSQEEANKFQSSGAVGSHLENLQRREGFKGFNQKNVSSIIKKVDPRTVHLT